MMRGAIQQQSYTSREIVVLAGDCRFTTDPACRLIARNLESCVALAVHAPELRMAALLRFILPQAIEQSPEANPWLSGDIAVPLVFAYFRQMGARNRDLAVYAAGGAMSNDGKRNLLTMRRVLWREGVLLRGDDTGGACSRSLWFNVGSGRVLVRSRSAAAAVPVPPSAQGDRGPLCAVAQRSQGATLCHFAS